MSYKRKLDTLPDQKGCDFNKEVENSNENCIKMYHAEQIEIRDLQEGDHIAVEHDESLIFLTHHGIFLGFTEGVAHVVGTRTSGRKVVVGDLSKFMNGTPLLRINHPLEKCHLPKTTVAIAKEFVERPERWPEFDLLRNNCEHFAMYCKTGKASSPHLIEMIRRSIAKCIKHAVRICCSSFGSCSS